MDNPGPSILAFMILLIFSAFFSASETSLSSINRVRMKTRAEDGDKKARKVLDLADDYDRTLSTILIGNNVVNLASASISTVLCTTLMGANGAVVATGVTTVLVLIFGEILTKSLAKERPDYRQNKKQILAGLRTHAETLLQQVGLGEKMELYPHQLSGGQQQRVAIARALALSPDILCFDEPTSALDPELTGEVLRVIRGLREQRMTMIVVTHEMAFARDVADRVIFMDGGVIVEQGPARQVIEAPQEARTRRFLSSYAGI